MIKALKKLQTIYFCIVRVNWIKFFQLYDSKSDVILWYYPGFRKKLFMQSVERDFAFIAAFIEKNQKFKIYFGRNIGKFNNSIIFYSVTKYYELFGFNNYTLILHHISKQLEMQGNRVYPTSEETLYWENKDYMHQKFDELGVSSPKTKIIYSIEEATQHDIPYPVLMKEPHSSSSMGLYKVSSEAELLDTITKNKLFDKTESLLIQELLNMRKDLRVITVGNKVCSYYWRINLAKEWRPTATGYGSKVDFVFFPEEWRGWMEETATKLELTTAGFDVTWQNDDLGTTPIILEVSPFYQPNPPADLTGKAYSYGEYKKKLLFTDSWDKRFVDIIFDLQLKTVDWFLSHDTRLSDKKSK